MPFNLKKQIQQAFSGATRRFRPRPRGVASKPALLIRRYLDGGRIPWAPGYAEYRLESVLKALHDEDLLSRFRDGLALPSGYGDRLDERVVEYPWAFSRSANWGRRLLDAGSTLNDPALLALPPLKEREVIVYDLAHHWMAKLQGVSYIAGDLRNTMLRDDVVDVVVCISTLEHIGLDNTKLYTADERFNEARPRDYLSALREFRRILRPDGRLLVTVPFGRAGVFGWFQQFDAAGVAEIIAAFGGKMLDLSYFRYRAGEWVRATASECADCEYFDIHEARHFEPDFAAAARAVACIELVKP